MPEQSSLAAHPCWRWLPLLHQLLPWPSPQYPTAVGFACIWQDGCWPEQCPGTLAACVSPSPAGEVLFGTDSHTCNAGAFGQFASGIGNTDAGFILGTGKLLVSRGPDTQRCNVENLVFC